MAVRDFIPVAGNTLLKLACPPLSVAVPIVVVPFMNVTVPVGVSPSCGVTVAAKATDCPAVEGFSEESSAVVVGTLVHHLAQCGRCASREVRVARVPEVDGFRSAAGRATGRTTDSDYVFGSEFFFHNGKMMIQTKEEEWSILNSYPNLPAGIGRREGDGLQPNNLPRQQSPSCSRGTTEGKMKRQDGDDEKRNEGSKRICNHPGSAKNERREDALSDAIPSPVLR
jgi:hypothetical protein